ncbi:MAG: hypothetical protein DME45_02290 [Verrucomicrobia bacterium]|nr:MAG: hypothetical protein DME45_02290 [Verrucomicrobiota bacterium]
MSRSKNKTFKDLANLDVKYVIFFIQEQLGAKAAPTKRQQSGSFIIDVLRGHQKKMFSTNRVELKKPNLVGVWIYIDGAKPKRAGQAHWIGSSSL